MNIWTIGIDPGAKGAISLLDRHGELLECEDMPSPDGTVSGASLADLIDNWMQPRGPLGMVTAIVEKVGAMPKQGVASTFKFGTNYGVALGVLGALRIRTVLVTPAQWKREMRLSRDKGASRAAADRRWPSDADLFRRVKDDGRAEAALIAAWWLDGHGRRQDGAR